MNSSDLLAEAWSAVTAGSDDQPRVGPGDLRITGDAGWLPSRFRAEDAAVASVGAALLAAAALQEVTGGASPTVALDRHHVADAVRSERYIRQGTRPAALGFAPLSRFWPTADGWIRSHANYPWHRAAFLRTLGLDDVEDPDQVSARTRSRSGSDLEDAVFGAGGIAAAVRTLDEWRQHPQGAAVAREPLVAHERAGDAPARRPEPNPRLPASGLRVLDFTRVVAGPVCTRLLGALGADVLRVDPPGHPDMAIASTADSLLGKRSAGLDLEASDQLEVLHELMARADLVVCGYRPSALDRFGLGADSLAARHPGLVVVVLDAWGHTGPWAGRRGFDSVVQAPTGIADGEGDDEAPGALPCQLLDHGTGYLAAAAALDGILRQRTGGGTHIRRVSLARTAAWLCAAGRAPTGPPGPDPSRDERGDPPWIVELPADSDTVRAVAPPGSIDGRPLKWPGAPARYQQDRAKWK